MGKIFLTLFSAVMLVVLFTLSCAKTVEGFEYILGTDYYDIPAMTKPAKGETVIEPNFHTEITRVSDKTIDGYYASAGEGMAIEYCRSDPENSDGTYFLFAVKEYVWYLYDAVTFEMIKKLDAGHLGYSYSYDGGPIEPRWDANDPNVFYFVLPSPSSRPLENQATFRKYTIKDRLTYPDTQDTVTVVHDFKNEFPTATSIQTDTEGDPSMDGRIWAWKVKSGGTLLAYVVYDKDQDEIIARWDNPPYNWNWISVSPSGKYIGLSSRNSPVADFGNRIITIDGAPGHSDWAVDAEGRDCRIYQNTHHDQISMACFDGSLTGGGGSIAPVYDIPAWSLPVTHLIDLPSPCCPSIHLSGSNYLKPGWGLVSIGNEKGTWLDYQIFMVELNENKCEEKYYPWNGSKGSCSEKPTIWRLTSLCSHNPTYFSGYASINEKGTKIFWSSNWDEGEDAPIEAYIIDLPSTWYEDLSQPPPSCSELGGTCCSSGQSCEGGNFQFSSDCGSLCCVGGTCEEIPVTCPDGNCDPGECNTCPQDCTFSQCCPDGTCNNGETCSTCPEDCGTCPVGEFHWLEAEYPDSITSPLQVDSDANASEGQYIQVPQGTGDVTDPSLVTGIATYQVTITEPSDYVLWGRTISPTGEDDSFFIEVDSLGDNLWDLQDWSDSWSWDVVSDRGSGTVSNPETDPVIFTLSVGTHTIKVKQREDGTRLDKLLLTNDLSYVPTGIGEPAENLLLLCGNFVCDTGECNTCPQDCTFTDCCPDGDCNAGETCSTCSQDCGDCPTSGVCNDLVLLMHLDNQAQYGEDSAHMHDFSNNGNDGSCSGLACPTPVTGRFSGAFEFDGDDYINVPDDDTLDGYTSMSWSFWLYLSENPTTSRGLFDKYLAQSGKRSYVCQITSSEDLNLRVSSDGINSEIHTAQTNLPYGDSTFHHIVIVFDGGIFDVYVDGEVVSDDGDFSTQTSIYSGTTDFSIGSFYSSTKWKGLIDELAIWNRSLSASEIQQLYDSGNPISCEAYHRADTNQDGCITIQELMAFLYRWKVSSQDVPMPELMEAISRWKYGTGCP